MRGAVELLDELKAHGIEVQATDGRLHARPSAALTPELRAALSEGKDDLIALLQGVPAAPVNRRVKQKMKVRPGQVWAIRDPDPWKIRRSGAELEILRVIGDGVGYRYLTGELGVMRIADLRQRCALQRDDTENSESLISRERGTEGTRGTTEKSIDAETTVGG